MLSVILLFMVVILFSTLSVIRFSELWQLLGLASDLESDWQDIGNWKSKWHVDFSAGNLILFYLTNQIIMVI